MEPGELDVLRVCFNFHCGQTVNRVHAFERFLELAACTPGRVIKDRGCRFESSELAGPGSTLPGPLTLGHSATCGHDKCLLHFVKPSFFGVGEGSAQLLMQFALRVI